MQLPYPKEVSKKQKKEVLNFNVKKNVLGVLLMVIKIGFKQDRLQKPICKQTNVPNYTLISLDWE